MNFHRFFYWLLALVIMVALGGAYAAAPSVQIERTGSNVTVSFTGHLQGAPEVRGPYKDIVGATNPHVQLVTNAAQQFWRSRVPGASTFAAGTTHSVAIKSDGSLWAWGNNASGQLGTGESYLAIAEPQRVGTDSNWAAIASGLFSTLALKADGTLWQWGGNQTNQPKQLGTEADWRTASVGDDHFMAIKKDGTLWGWGENRHGQLGLGNYEDFAQPVRVGLDTNWLFAAAGFRFTLAIRTDATLWAWGSRDRFGTGPGDFINTNQPTLLDLDRKWHVAARGFLPDALGQINIFALVLQADGTLWGCGYNHYGQLGNGTRTHTNRLTQAGSDTDWLAVTCGNRHTVALKTNGTLWQWGLGINQPVQIGTETDWAALSAGGRHTLALKHDGSLWSWGDNDYGQLGSTRPSGNQPMQVLSNIPWAQ